MLRIVNGTIVTGDGLTMISGGTVSIHEDRIVGISSQYEVMPDDTVIDAQGCLVFPGIINHHVHGVAPGPLFPSAAPALPIEKVRENLTRHICEGSTTILNVDGFATMEDIEEARKLVPINLMTATSHTPLNFKAAVAVDGTGLKERHKAMTAKKMVEAGAVAIGEIGGGHTLGGGGQDYLYIPRAIRERTGVEITAPQAKKLKFAALGRYVDVSAYDEKAMKTAMQAAGLEGCISPEITRQLICNSVLPSIQLGLDAFLEAAEIANQLGKTSIYHNSAPSMNQMLNITKKFPNIIAGHSNHTTFDPDESVSFARKLKEAGGIIDVSTLKLVSAGIYEDIRPLYEFYRSGLVDTITTDYAAGFWNSVLYGLDHIIKETGISLTYAIATATSNVEKAIPGIAPDRGLIEQNKIADITIASAERLYDIKYVLLGGRIVVKDGKLLA